jgi:hypothetical protein
MPVMRAALPLAPWLVQVATVALQEIPSPVHVTKCSVCGIRSIGFRSLSPVLVSRQSRGTTIRVVPLASLVGALAKSKAALVEAGAAQTQSGNSLAKSGDALV